MVKVSEDKIVFALSPPDGSNARLVIVGIPAGAWEYMKEGKTNNFDLTKVGVPVKFVLFGAKNHDSAMAVLQAGAAATGDAMLDERRRDFTIPEHPAITCWELCDQLRAEEADSVELISDNPHPEFGGGGNAVICSGSWTDYKPRRFTGDTILAALQAAVEARQKK